MMNDYLIKNGRVIDPANKLDKVCDVLISEGKVRSIGDNLKIEKGKIIDVKNMVVCPGLIDVHVHFREPGQEGKETIESGLRSALAGGFTSVLTMPNTSPPADNNAVIEYQLSTGRKLDLGKLYTSGNITKNGAQVSNMKSMKEAGILAVTDDGMDVQDEGLFKHAIEWAKTFDLPVFCHAEIDSLSADGCMHQGSVAVELGLPGIPRSAEDLAIMKAIILSEEVGHHVHISHISTRGGVEAVRMAKKKGLQITAEVTPHHFSLTHEECRNWNTNAKMYPPLREESDRQAVLEGLADGTIDIIASDHAPHKENEKQLPFIDAPKGTVGLETTLGAALQYLYKTKALSLSEIVEKLTLNPAKLIRINAGTLSKGAPADVTIFDPEKKWKVDPKQFESKGKNSVFSGKTLQGKVEYVFVDGEMKIEKGSLL